MRENVSIGFLYTFHFFKNIHVIKAATHIEGLSLLAGVVLLCHEPLEHAGR